MKIGVSTIPWGKTKLPRRAELVGSVAKIEKDTEEPGEIGQMPIWAKLNHTPRWQRKNSDFSETFSTGRSFETGPNVWIRSGNFLE